MFFPISVNQFNFYICIFVAQLQSNMYLATLSAIPQFMPEVMQEIMPAGLLAHQCILA
jgi:hypothetical protein